MVRAPSAPGLGHLGWFPVACVSTQTHYAAASQAAGPRALLAPAPLVRLVQMVRALRIPTAHPPINSPSSSRSGAHSDRDAPELPVAHHKDAIKRDRQNTKRNAYNRHYRTLMRGTVKKLRAIVADGDGTAAAAALPNAVSIVQKIASKGVIHKRQAARRVSRMAKAVNAALKA